MGCLWIKVSSQATKRVLLLRHVCVNMRKYDAATSLNVPFTLVEWVVPNII